MSRQGFESVVVSPRFVKAEVSIDGQFATTDLWLSVKTWGQGADLDLSYTLPPHTVVTSLALHNRDETVPARVVDLARAKSIYESASHYGSTDESVSPLPRSDRSTFRTRFFGNYFNTDLQIEMRLRQVLPSDATGAVFELPLAALLPREVIAEPNEPKTLDALNVRVRVRPEADLDVTNNFDLPFEKSDDGLSFSLLKTDFAPDRNLRVHLMRRSLPLRAQVQSGRADAKEADGFFALALTPDVALSGAQVRISGVKTYDVLSWQAAPAVDMSTHVHGETVRKLNDMAAHETVVLWGRYKGGGTAMVTLSGTAAKGAWSESQTVSLDAGANRLQSEFAATGWASLRLMQLDSDRSGSDAEKADRLRAATELGARFGLPGPGTTWLAVPSDVMKRYEESEKWTRIRNLEAKVIDLIEPLIVEIVNGRPNGAKAQRIREQVTALLPPDSNVRVWIDAALANRLSFIRAAWDEARSQPRPDKKRLAQLEHQIVAVSQYRGESAASVIKKLRQEQTSDRESAEMDAAVKVLAQEVKNNQAQSPLARRSRSRLKILAPRLGRDTRDEMRELLRAKLDTLASQWTEEKLSKRPNASRLQTLRRQLEVMTRDTSITAQTLIGDWKRTGKQRRQDEIVDEVMQLRRSAQPDAVREAALRREYTALLRDLNQMKPRYGYYSLDEMLKFHEEVQANSRAHTVAYLLAEERQRAQPDATRIAALRSELEKVAGKNFALFNDQANSLYLERHPNDWSRAIADSRALILQELQKTPPDAARLDDLSRQFARAWEGAGFTSSGAAQEVAKQRAALQKLRDETANANARGDIASLAQIDNRRVEVLRNLRWFLEARPGDPLLRIEAPADAQQVVALLPRGEIKPLKWNARSALWEVRFDIPTYARDGEYRVTVIIVGRDGTRTQKTLRYLVDTGAPKGRGQARIERAGVDMSTWVLRLQMNAGPDTTRVFALLPWGERVRLLPSAERDGRFFALVPLPRENDKEAAQASAVTYILTDRAHNRTTFFVDISR